MDWQRVKKAATDFDAVMSKTMDIQDACEDAQIMLAALVYCDAKWIADHPKEQRKEKMERIFEPMREDVKDMARMIIKNEI